MLVATLALILLALSQSAITLINAIEIGAKDSDPEIYWPATGLVVLVTIALMYVTLRLCVELYWRVRNGDKGP